MALPQGFSEWEHLQSVIMQVHNRIVREEFEDADDDDIATPRSSLKQACLLKDSDSAIQTLIRYWLFYVDIRKAQDLNTPVYGIPIPGYQEARKFKPQIQLYFQEDYNDIEAGFAPVTGEISFRLMTESEESLTENDARNYAQKIKTAFGSGSRFVWKKGKVQAVYTDRKHGYQLRLLVKTEAEGRRIVEQVLDIQGHAPDWKNLNISENAEPSARFPSLPSSERIFGKTRRLPRQRPTADVRFQYALLHIHGLPHPIVLVDYAKVFRNPLLDT